MADIIAQATQAVADGSIPTAAIPTGVDTAGALQTASNVANAAATVAQVADAAASTVLDVKAAWSSPENCFNSNYCRIPVAIIIVIGISIIIGCICCIKGCADCIACCCCRSSKRSRERLRPPEPGLYPYGQQPPPYQPQRSVGPGGGGLFPMPERPKYERLGDEEQAINLADMKPKHAYLDGDSVVSDPPIKEGTTPSAGVAVAAPIARLPRTPPAPYSLHDDHPDGYHDGHYAPPPPIASAAGRSSPVRRDYSPSPVRADFRSDHGGLPYSSSHQNNSYDRGYNGGAYRDDYDSHYNDAHYYENTRGGYGSSRGGGFNV